MSEQISPGFGLYGSLPPRPIGKPREVFLLDVAGIEPLTDARREKMTLEETNQANAAIIDHIATIAEKHFAAAGREFKLRHEPTAYWDIFGIHLCSALIPNATALDDPKYLALLRGVGAEMFDFLMYALDGQAAYTIYQLTDAFGSGVRGSGSLFDRLLPDRAAPMIAKVDQIADSVHEADIERQNMMGY